ncbi:MAG TPA: rhomboid family intramembrane serine protease [Candidatus Baltobacteraceae bacterium]|nr:rhomboid family intramembrane serine protease [Candidatus Baltobacteraceae bacterium]
MIPIADEDRQPIFPVVVYLIVAINIAVFAREMLDVDPTTFIDNFALIPYDVMHGIRLPPPSPGSPFLTLVTSQFIHGSLLHIGFNLLFLLVFGPDVEYLCGHLRFLVFYLLCGIVGGIAQISVDPGGHIPSLGASGAIAGVLGAYIVNFPRNQIRTILPILIFPMIIRLPAVAVIGVWAIIQVILGFSQTNPEQEPGVAYFAHIGGFAAGVLTIYVMRERLPGPRRYRYYF